VKTVKIAPSEIAFLYDKCRACWYRKCHGLQKPKEQLPQMYSRVDKGMKALLGVKEMNEFFGIPAVSTCSFEHVISTPIVYEEHGCQIVISGKIDKAFVLEDGTLALIEYKMTEPSERNVNNYSRQLHCYEMALRLPAKGEAREVSRMDLIFYEPFDDYARVKRAESGQIICTPTSGALIHRPVEIDRAAFERDVIEEMAKIAGSPDMPEAGQWCDYCASLKASVVYDRDLAALSEKRRTA
jgi:hypothetical protein